MSGLFSKVTSWHFLACLASWLTLVLHSFVGTVAAARIRDDLGASMVDKRSVCIGSYNGFFKLGLGGAGNCTDRMYCYQSCLEQLSAGVCSGSVAASGGSGVCHLADGWTCKSDSQCRPGAICSSGDTCAACPNSKKQPMKCLLHAMMEAHERWLTLYHEVGLLDESIDPGSMTKAMTTTSRYMSEHIVPVTHGSGDLVKRVQLAVKSSSLEAEGKGSSRSGASFYMTGDQAFFVKAFDRVQEYSQLVQFLGGPPGFSSDPFKYGENGSTFNLPVMSFPAFDSTFWLVMPNADHDFRAGFAADPVEKAVFDVKPIPLISDDRVSFLHHLRNQAFTPVSDSEKERALFRALDHDLAWLDTHDIVDYSWLAYEYDFGKISDSDWSHLESSAGYATPNNRWCFKASPIYNTAEHVNRRVLCITLIDFTLPYETNLQGLESAAMAFKWDDYGIKFRHFTYCLLHLAPTQSAIKEEFNLVSIPKVSVLVGRLSIAVVIDDLRVNPEAGQHPPPYDCEEYRSAACKKIVVKSRAPPSLNKCTLELDFLDQTDWVKSGKELPWQGDMREWIAAKWANETGKDAVARQVQFCSAYFIQFCLQGGHPYLNKLA